MLLPMREIIIGEIQRLARENGEAPGQKLFVAKTGIAQHQWRGRFWSKWGDALLEAGFQPNDWQGRLDSEEVLRGVVVAVRHYGRMPTKSETQLLRQSNSLVPTDNTIQRHFGRRDDLITALARLAAEKAEFADIAPMLPAVRPSAQAPRVASKAAEGYVYLLKSGDFYKIGRSDELERRVKEITVALPDKATLIHSIRTDDPPGIEGYWHRRFADRRANGEWFKLTASDVAAFRKRKFQ